MEIWPNFFIVGAPKAGTTSLYAYLKNVPGIYMSPIKEPNYFSPITLTNKKRKSISEKSEYLNLFSNISDENVLGEASVCYLADPQAPTLIHQIIPHARILISLRDPVERAYSAFLMAERRGSIKTSFHELVRNVKAGTADDISKSRILDGLYFENVTRYLKIFGEKQVKIIIFEDFIKSPKKTIEAILKFLEIQFQIDSFDSKVHNPYVGLSNTLAKKLVSSSKLSKLSQNLLPNSTRLFIREKLLVKNQSKPKMDDGEKEDLINFYREDVAKIKTLLGRDLPWKNFD